MPTERFPKRKYLRQLYDMEHELQEWRYVYLASAAETPNEWLEGRLTDRAAVLEDAAYRVLKAAEMIEGVPRIT
jgi:predicted RNA-binding protein with EMAP domain